MKKRFQKLTSIVLVLMMLVTMLPAGMFVATAEVSADLAAGLADYDNTAVFVINSVEDWNAVVATSYQFEGKTVLLGADIDAEGGTLPTLFASFAGTFDGQSKTIKNATVSGEGDVGLIATALTDGANFSNVNFDTITVTSTGTGLVHAGVIGASYTGAADLTVQNVKATGITINHAGSGSVGGLIGNLALGVGSDGSKAYFTNIVFDGTITTATNNQGDGYMTGYGAGGLAGGVIATHTGWDDPVHFYAQNADVTVTINATTTTATYAGLGGILGRFGSVSNAHIWNISNCRVNATITAGGPYAGTGALVGYTCGGNDVITDTIANLTFETTTYQGVIGMKRNGADITVTNLWSTTASMRALMKISDSELINGADANNFAATAITAQQSVAMVTKNESGFITAIAYVEPEPEPEPDPDPDPTPEPEPEPTEELVIDSVAKWNEIAASTTDYSNYIVKLGANLDFAGATVSPLFQTAFGGTFDGQGYAIKNATVTTTGDAALIATTLTGTVKNLNLENCSVTGTAKVGMIAASATNATITNVNATGNVTNTTNAGYTGGIVGYVTVSTGGSFSNIWTKIVVKAEKVTDGGWLGGFCGQVNITGTADWTMTNCYISGAIDNGATSSTNATGLWGKTNGTQGQDIALLTNVIVDMDMSLAYGNSLVIGYHANGNIVTSNLYSTTKANNGTWTATTVRWSFLTQNGASFINEKTNPWAAGDPAGDASVEIVSTEIAAYMPVMDETTGFMTGITAPEDVVLPEPEPDPDPTPEPEPEPTPETEMDVNKETDYTINSVDDWNTIANSDEDFTGKKIVLGADIDFAGATITPLFKNAFYGIFDGQGYTIKNAVVTSTADAALIALTLNGGIIKNVKFDTISVTGNGTVGLLAATVSTTAKLEISGIKATAITVSNAGAATGGFIGKLINNGNTVSLSKINIQGTVTHTGGTTVPGFVGAGSSSGAGGYAGGFFAQASFTAVGTMKFSGIKSEMNVTATTTTHVAGFISYVVLVSGTKAEFENIYVGGSLIDNYANTAWSAGFVGKFAGVAGEDCATINNLVLNIDRTGSIGNALIFAGVHNGNLVYTNVFSSWGSNGGGHSTTTVRWTGMSHNTASFFNGTYSAWASADPIQNTVTVVDAADIALYIVLDEDGFITKIEKPENPNLPNHNEEVQDIVIDSVEDWNAVADMNLTFTGSTIKLGADIDFAGATIKPLFGNKTFHGIFDGQGYTIKNAVLAGTSNIALIAPVLGGGKITNVKFDNITISTSDGYVGLIAGNALVWADLEISKINATNITITNTGKGNTGGLIGNLVNNGFTAVITKINFQGAVNHDNDAGHVGGILGTASINGTTQWSNITVDAAIFAKQGAVANYVGGFAGIYTVGEEATIDITNIVIKGSIDGNGSSTPQNAGFVAKFVGTAGKDLGTIKNIIIAINMSKACGNSIVFAGIQEGNLVYSDVYSTTGANNGTWSSTTLRWTGMSYNQSSLFNGIYNPWAAGDPIKDSVMIIPATLIDLMVKLDEEGYVASITSIAENDDVIPNYDTTEEFVISSVEDWVFYASSNKSFAGKIIKLAADIDAKGATLPMLIMNMSATNVIFDGCGFTIKNVGTATAPNLTPLIACQLGAATIKNVNFENVYISTADAAGLIAFSIAADGTTLIENIKVIGCKITSTGNAAGSLVGSMKDKVDTDTVTIRNITIDANTVISGAANTGGLIGDVENVGTLNIFNIYTAAKVTGSSNTFYVGGLVGQTNSTVNGKVNIINCYVGGALESTGDGPLGGVAGRFTGYAGETIVGADGSISFKTAKTITLKNLLLDCQFLLSTARMTVWIGTMQGQGYINYDNIMTTNTTSGNRPKPQWKLVAINSNTMVNGKPMNGEIPSPSAGDLDDIVFVVPEIGRKLVIMDEETGFLKNINAQVEAYTYQYSEVIDGKYSIRFVGTSMFETEETIFMNVKATTASGQVKIFSVQSPGMEKLFPFEDHNIDESIVAADIGVKKMLSVTVYDIPVGEDITFEFWVTMETPSGGVVTSTQTITVTFDATGAPVVAA